MFTPVRFRYRMLWGPVLLATTLSACGASYRVLRFEPVAPQGAPPVVRTHISGVLKFDLSGAILTISPVVQSERMAIAYAAGLPIPTPLSEETALDNPLHIVLDFRLNSGKIRITPGNVTVAVEATDQKLRPVATKVQSMYWAGSKWNPVTNTVSGPVELEAREKSWDFVIFTYDVSVKNLKPFMLEIGGLVYHEETVAIPPIPFELKSALTST